MARSHVRTSRHLDAVGAQKVRRLGAELVPDPVLGAVRVGWVAKTGIEAGEGDAGSSRGPSGLVLWFKTGTYGAMTRFLD